MGDSKSPYICVARCILYRVAIRLTSQKWTQIKNDKSHVSDGLCPLRNEQRSPVRAVDLVHANRTEKQMALL